MRYKGDYSPSYLVDPEDYTWAPLDKCRPLLDKYHYACFTHPERSLEAPATSPGAFHAMEDGSLTHLARRVRRSDTEYASRGPPERATRRSHTTRPGGSGADYSKSTIKCDHRRVALIHIPQDSAEWQRQQARETLLITLDALGEKLSQEIIFDLSYEL